MQQNGVQHTRSQPDKSPMQRNNTSQNGATSSAEMSQLASAVDQTHKHACSALKQQAPATAAPDVHELPGQDPQTQPASNAEAACRDVEDDSAAVQDEAAFLASMQGFASALGCDWQVSLKDCADDWHRHYIQPQKQSNCVETVFLLHGAYCINAHRQAAALCRLLTLQQQHCLH